MDALQLWGLELIKAIQQIHGPVLDSIMQAITFFGSEDFYLLLLPALVWSIDYQVGIRLGIILLFSSYLNTDIKDLFQQPRPFTLDPAVKLSEADGYSLPSGHAQSATVVWGSLGVWVRKTWFWALAILLIVLVGFSRIYLGVHFPTDVLAGWAIGAGLFGIFLATSPGIQSKIARLNYLAKLLLALGAPIILVLLYPVEDTISATATLAGIGVGLVLGHKYVPFSAQGIWWQRILRFIIGILIVIGLFFGLRAVLPAQGEPLFMTFRFVRYLMVGLWVTLGGPWVFRLLKLAPNDDRN